MNQSIKINGRSYSFNDKTLFQVQVGKDKGSYKTAYSFNGDIRKAAFYYECLNIGNKYKKRLLLDGKAVI